VHACHSLTGSQAAGAHGPHRLRVGFSLPYLPGPRAGTGGGQGLYGRGTQGHLCRQRDPASAGADALSPLNRTRAPLNIPDYRNYRPGVIMTTSGSSFISTLAAAGALRLAPSLPATAKEVMLINPIGPSTLTLHDANA